MTNISIKLPLCTNKHNAFRSGFSQAMPPVKVVPIATEQVDGIRYRCANLQKRARESQLAHAAASTWNGYFHVFFGLVSIILSVLAGITGARHSKVPDEASGTIPLVLGMLAAIVTGVQTFMKFEQQAAKHDKCSKEWKAFRSDIEDIATVAPADYEKHYKLIKAKEHTTSEHSIPVSPIMLWWALRWNKKDGYKPIFPAEKPTPSGTVPLQAGSNSTLPADNGRSS